MDKNIAGYQITDYISLCGVNYALGRHPTAPAAFAVWQTNEDFSQFWFGHYFANEHAAIADMIMRATYQLDRPDGIPLSVDFMADNAKAAFEMQLIDEKAKSSIQEALEEVLQASEIYPTELTAKEILQNHAFMDQARHAYDNIDHSEEHYALCQLVEEILDENPRFLRSEPIKPSLSEQIMSAQEKAGGNSPQSHPEKEAER